MLTLFDNVFYIILSSKRPSLFRKLMGGVKGSSARSSQSLDSEHSEDNVDGRGGGQRFVVSFKYP